MKTKTHKRLVSAFFVWGFFNVLWLIMGITDRKGSLFSYEHWIGGMTSAAEDFFPFDEDARLEVYDFSEFFLYVGLPILIFYLYRYNKE